MKATDLAQQSKEAARTLQIEKGTLEDTRGCEMYAPASCINGGTEASREPQRIGSHSEARRTQVPCDACPHLKLIPSSFILARFWQSSDIACSYSSRSCCRGAAEGLRWAVAPAKGGGPTGNHPRAVRGSRIK